MNQDQYDLDNSELFQTSYTSEYFAQQQNQKHAGKQQVNQTNVDETVNETFVQEASHGINLEGRQGQKQITGSNVIEQSRLQSPALMDKSESENNFDSRPLEESKQEAQVIEQMQLLTMDQIDRPEQMTMNKSESLEMKRLDSIDLEMRLHIDVSGPRWHSDNVMYSGHYVFSIKSYRSGPSRQLGF